MVQAFELLYAEVPSFLFRMFFFYFFHTVPPFFPFYLFPRAKSQTAALARISGGCREGQLPYTL